MNVYVFPPKLSQANRIELNDRGREREQEKERRREEEEREDQVLTRIEMEKKRGWG